ncbi:MAG: alpha-L-fucosidase [Acidobacteria bacterium]|nr:alpha-L-fucosidase [Acidobacteriota bacterium]
MGAGGALAYTGYPALLNATPLPSTEADTEQATRAKRMQWWHKAKFGMFVHWGLYSLIGQHEWALEIEGIPIAQYELLARHFQPKPNAAREWARLARQAGQKYMVMTTKHHEGFCMFDTRLTDYSAAKQGPGRDLVREFVEAARAEGLRVGFYYSLMDWHHPDGARCASDEAARKRFVAYTHGLVRELMTNYGKIDILWYDVDWPLKPEQWESEHMNQMVFELQPGIIVNNRNGLAGDFATPEQEIRASEEGRAWESCMTLNESWGFNRGDDAWKTPKTIVRNLIKCVRGGGNYLLNIGPKPDGSIPEESVRILEAVGQWTSGNGAAIYGAQGGELSWGVNTDYTRKGNKLYVHVYNWPSDTPAVQWMPIFQTATVVALGGLQTKVKAVRLLKSGEPVTFTQEEYTVRFTGLPKMPPDNPATVLEVECEGEPVLDHEAPRAHWPRLKTGISS